MNGELIEIKPMSNSDKEKFYQWATNSDATSFWYGELYGNQVPDEKLFFKDWKDHYFNAADLKKGQCFFIVVDGREVGEINYNNINPDDNSTEIDILIASRDNWGKGYGSAAIKVLAKYLFEKLGVKTVWVAAIKKNPRAISVYRKAGFSEVKPPERLKNDDYWKNKDWSEWIFLELRKKRVD